MKDRRRYQWKKLVSKASLARRQRIEDLFSERTGIQRKMHACENLLSKEYADLLKQLRENSAELACEAYYE